MEKGVFLLEKYCDFFLLKFLFMMNAKSPDDFHHAEFSKKQHASYKYDIHPLPFNENIISMSNFYLIH